MDVQRLSSIAADAVLTVFHFRDRKISSLDDIYRRAIQDAVEDLWPLRPQARCSHVAHLEIASDAAVTCAEVFNQRNPEQAMNKRWVYMCVQNLLTLELKPALLLDGAVARLGELEPKNEEHTRSSPSLEASAEESSSWVKSVGNDDDDDDDYDNEYEDDVLVMSDQDGDDGQSAVLPKSIAPPPTPPENQPKKGSKTPWTEEDVRRMVKLKDFEGLTHEEVASRIGRGKGSVENKYGRVVKETKWKLFAEACRMRSGRGAHKRRARDENDDEGEDGMGEGQPAKKRQRR